MSKEDPICSGCGKELETLEHLLLKCKKANEIWKAAPVQWDGIQELTGNFNNWWAALFEAIQRDQGLDHISLTAYILWQIWKNRNEKEFNNKTHDPAQVINKAWNAWMEFNDGIKKAKSCSIGKTTTPLQMEEQEDSQIPDNRTAGMQIRIATKWSKTSKSIGYGIVAADCRGQDVMGWKMRESESSNQHQHEAESVKWALIKAAEQGWRLVCIGVPGTDLL
ncbi:uncharacterized protein [Coffea arabica]|uniref:RNase H type-1 domain-containing protein n=1 Tax=Coffea arabica TaxID=13443 RepID=A0ABM4VXC6_COFAR